MVKTKRIISLLIAVISALGVCFLTACKTATDDGGEADGKITYSFAISKTAVTLEAGQSEKLECSYGDKRIIFSSSDDKIATVSKNGTINAVSAGVAYITAKADGVDGAEKMCKVTVVKYEYSVEIDREASITAVIKDKAVTLDFVAVVYKDGEKSDLIVNFTVSPAGANLVANGNAARVTFSAAGEYTVKAAYAGKTATVTVKVVNNVA